MFFTFLNFPWDVIVDVKWIDVYKCMRYGVCASWQFSCCSYQFFKTFCYPQISHFSNIMMIFRLFYF
jgi:hypothetical protein